MNGKINGRRWAAMLSAGAALAMLGGCAVMDPWDIGEPTSYYDDGYYSAYPDYYYGAPATSLFVSGYSGSTRRGHRTRGHHRRRGNRADAPRRNHARPADQGRRAREANRANRRLSRQQNNIDYGYSRPGSPATRSRGSQRGNTDFGYSRP